MTCNKTTGPMHTPREALEIAMLIVIRCRQEGRDAKLAGAPNTACPYIPELERSGWLDGWTRA
jgi:ribosome modulation factor